ACSSWPPRCRAGAWLARAAAPTRETAVDSTRCPGAGPRARRRRPCEDRRQLMERAGGTQDVVLEQLHYALEAPSVAAHERDLVRTTLRDRVRNLDGRVGILNRAPCVGRQSREGRRVWSLQGPSDLC